LNRRHDRDFLARLRSVTAIYKFHARADESAFVVLTQRRLHLINLVEQLGDRRLIRKIDIEMCDPGHVPQLRKQLDADFHWANLRWSLVTLVTCHSLSALFGEL